jgi:primosomal protein N' (replication factor Y)
MIQFEFNGSDPRKLDQWCAAIEDSLLTMLESNSELARCVRVLGPAPAPIEVIRGRTRRTIMIVSPSRPACRTVATHLQKLVSAPPGDIRVKIDVDPQSTL